MKKVIAWIIIAIVLIGLGYIVYTNVMPAGIGGKIVEESANLYVKVYFLSSRILLPLESNSTIGEEKNG